MLRWIFIPCLLCFANILYSTQETVEEGKPVTLKCTDLVVSKTHTTLFSWYKERLANKLDVNRIAFYDNYDGAQNSEGDFANRIITIDGTTGALTLLNTTVSDDHFYSCWFTNTATGDIGNETQLTITVTPSRQDLKITTSPTGPVKEGETVSFKCSAPRVKPPPREIYWQFTDDENQHNGIYRNDTNADKLTSSVSVDYTMVVKRKDNGRKLICHYTSETGNDIQSEEATVEVLYMPTGQSQIQGGKRTVEVNATVSLTCDTEQIDGIITWYKWQFANGTELGNTTKKTWTYTARENEETLQIVCIAGNAAGQSNASEPIAIEIQRIGTNDKLMYIGIAIGCALAVIFIILGVCFFVRRRKQMDDLLEPEIQVNVNYSQVSEGGEVVYAQPMKKPRNKKNSTNVAPCDVYAQPIKKPRNKKNAPNGDHLNGNLGNGRTLSKDGLIYSQPDFGNRPGPVVPPKQGAAAQGPPKPPRAPKPLADHIPTDYGEVDFKKMEEMKKK